MREIGNLFTLQHFSPSTGSLEAETIECLPLILPYILRFSPHHEAGGKL